jgi:solute carrier family 20 (sodium-dependent phosphate transporter)
MYGFLQIFSAICVMFAHGAGEVGYMAGPLATIWDVYNNVPTKLNKTVNAPIWIVVISALSLVSGLATYGKNVTKAVGKDLAKITPSRGFCAEISTAMVIMVAAQYGLPTSSSQAITGGIVGVGLAEGLTGVNWLFFFETFCSWVMTMVVMGLGTALMFAQGHNAP